jgi:hypothetical protein
MNIKTPYVENYKGYQITVERVSGVGFRSQIAPVNLAVPYYDCEPEYITIEQKYWTKDDIITFDRERIIENIIYICRARVKELLDGKQGM